MEYKLEKAPGVNVVGIKVRTCNGDGSAMQDIPALWNRFFSENILEQVSGRKSDEIIAVYTEYDGDYLEPYTMFVGCEVSDLSEVPEGLEGVTVPGATFAVYDVAGEFPQALMSAWEGIWQSPYDRDYTADFERYPADFMPAADKRMSIYVAVDPESA